MRHRTRKRNKVEEVRDKCEGKNEKKPAKQRKTVTNPGRES